MLCGLLKIPYPLACIGLGQWFQVIGLSGRMTETRPTKQWLHYTFQVGKEASASVKISLLQFLSGCSGDVVAEIFHHHYELLVNATAPVH